MSAGTPLFASDGAKPGAGDEELAATIARRLECDLPEECIAGVAANARILQSHADILRERGE